MNFSYHNLGIRALIIYFYFVLINLINDCKNIYSRNNNVCLGDLYDGIYAYYYF